MRQLKNPKATPSSYASPFIKEAAADLETFFETPVTVAANDQGKGVLKIAFDSQEKLQHILNKIKIDRTHYHTPYGINLENKINV